jgi:hypothetical protein
MHPIKRGALVVLLSLGAIGGFTHGFARMAQCHSSCASSGPSQRDEFEDHIADVCTRAAQRQWDEQEAAERAAEHHHHGYGGPQWGGPQQWGPPPQYWGAPPAPPAAALAPAAPVDSAPAAEPASE